MRECKDETIRQECEEFKDHRCCIDCEKLLDCKGVCAELNSFIFPLTEYGVCNISSMGTKG